MEVIVSHSIQIHQYPEDKVDFLKGLIRQDPHERQGTTVHHIILSYYMRDLAILMNQACKYSLQF